MAAEVTDVSGTNAPGIIAVCAIFSALSILFVGARLARCWRLRSFAIEDALVTLALFITLAVDGIFYAGAAYGFGRHASTLTPPDLHKILVLAWISDPVACWAFLTAKLSVGFTLLKLGFGPVFQAIVCFNMLLCFVINLWSSIMQLSGCNSYRVVNDNLPCRPTGIAPHMLYVQSGGNITVDIIYVVAIEVFLHRVKLSPRDRNAVRVVLLFMLTATICCAIKISAFPALFKSMDVTHDAIEVAALSAAEMNLTLSAACLPAVRLVFGKYFPRNFIFWKNTHESAQPTEMYGKSFMFVSAGGTTRRDSTWSQPGGLQGDNKGYRLSAAVLQEINEAQEVPAVHEEHLGSDKSRSATTIHEAFETDV